MDGPQFPSEQCAVENICAQLESNPDSAVVQIGTITAVLSYPGLSVHLKAVQVWL